jgi:hypothetical protein
MKSEGSDFLSCYIMSADKLIIPFRRAIILLRRGSSSTEEWLRIFNTSCFLTVANKCTLAKMFSYTVLFITSTCLGSLFDHLQGVVQSGYKQYFSDYTKCFRKMFQDSYQLIPVSTLL